MPDDQGPASLNRRLLLSTALAGGGRAGAMLATGMLATGMLAAGSPAHAQVGLPGVRALPDFNNAQTTTDSGDPNRAPVFQLAPVAGPGAQLNVLLRDRGTIINWGGTGFNIGANAGVDFADGFSADAGARNAIAVLNRDVNTRNDRSVILGSLTTSSDNISVYLLNRNGILFGPGANVSTGSFIASTLDLADDDFFAGGANQFTGTGGAITLQRGADLRGLAANGALALLAGSVDIQAGATINANGDVAIVAATDVSLTVEPGSPLSMTITRGTAVANPLVVAGTVGGRNVYLALATRDSVRNALLNVTGTVTATTALQTDRGVVLAAGAGANASGVTIAGSDTAGVAEIRIAGSVTARPATEFPDSPASIEIVARSGLLLDGARLLAQNGDVSVTGATRLTNASTVTASGAGSTISFGGTVDGPGGLTASADAETRFDGAVGAGVRLSSLTVGGLATLNAGTVRAGAIRLGGLGIGTLAPAAVTVDAGAGALVIEGSADAATADANRLTLIGGTIAVRDAGLGGRFAALTFTGATTLTGDLAAAGAVRFDGRLLLGAGVRRVSSGSADFGAVDAAGPAPAALSVTTTGASRFNAAVGGNRPIDLALRVGSVSFANTNQIGTLAAQVAGGGLSFTNGGSLSVGVVDGVNGVAVDSGDVRIATTSAASDLRLAAPVSASAGTLTLSAARNLTGIAEATVTGSGLVELRSTGGTIDLAGMVNAGGDLDASAPGLVRFGSLAAGRDVRVVAGGALTIAGTASGQDIALRAAGALTTGDLSARDDIVLRAGGLATLGLLTSGTAAEPGAAGAGDRLAGGTLFGGGDVDIVAAGVRLGPVRAGGAGSNIRLNGGAAGIGEAGRDLDLAAGGGIILTGTARGLDIALSAAGGAILTGDLNARDDIAVRATGAVTVANVASGVSVDGQAAGESGGAADALAGPLDGQDIDFDAGSIGVAAASANGAQSDLRVTASVGDLRLGAGRAGATAILTKAGSAGELQVTGSVRGGTAAANGDVVLTSSTNVRLPAASSASGTVSVLANGDVTGIGPSGRADLRAEANVGDVVVRAGGLARLGAADAGRDLSITAGDLDLLTGDARDIALRTVTGDATVGTLRARDDVAIRAAGTITGEAVFSGVDGSVDEAGAADALAEAALAGNGIDASGASIALGRAETNGNAASDLSLMANTGDLALGFGSAGGAATLVKTGATGELRVTGGLVTGGDARIASASSARLSSVTSRTGLLSVQAAGEATGGTLRADAGDVAVVGGSLVAFDTLSANGNLRAEAGSVRVVTGIAERGDLSLLASVGQLTLGAGRAGAGATLSKTGADGALEVTDLLTAGTAGAGGDVTISSATQARLGQAVSRTGEVRVTAASEITGAGTAPGATLRAGGDIIVVGGALARLAIVEAGRDVSVAADAVEVADGSGRDIALRSRVGRVALGTLRARDDIVVRATGEVTAAALRTGGEGAVDENGAADLLAERSLTGNDIDVAGASLDIASATAIGATSDLRLSATRGRLRLGDADVGGAVDLSADGADGELELAGALTFAGDASFSTARNFRFGAITSRTGTLRVRAGGDVVGNLLASERADVFVDAGASTSIGSLTAARDASVRAGSVQLGTVTVGRDLGVLARAGQLMLGRGGAGGNATLTKEGAAGELVVTEALAAGTGGAGGATVLTSSTNIRAARVEGGSVLIQASNGDVTGIGGDGRLNITARGAGGDAIVRAAGSARLGAVASARDVAVSAGSIDLTTAAGRDIALDAKGTATAGSLRARDDIVVRAAGAAALGVASAGMGETAEDASGAADALAGQALAGNDVDASGAEVSATAVTAAGSGGDVRLRASAGSLSLGSVTAAGGVTLAKEGAVGVLAATGPISAGGDVAIGSATDVRVATATSRAGSLVVDATREARGDSLTASAGSVTVRAGSILAFNGVAADGNVTGAADAVEIGTVTVAQGSLNLLARAGNLSLGSGVAATGVTLTKQGGAGELRVSGSLAAGGDVGINSATNIRLATVTSRAGSLVVDATRDARGDGLSAQGGSITARAGSILAFGDIAAGGNASGVADAIEIAAATSARGSLNLLARTGDLSLGRGAAAATAMLTKQGAAGELRVSGSLTAGGDVTVASSTNVRLANAASDAGRLAVTSAGDLTGAALGAPAGDGRAAPGFGAANLRAPRGGIAVTAGGAIAQLGAVSAGPGLTVKANDLDLLGAVTADRVEIINGGARGGARLGDGLAAAAGLNLGQAEFDRIDAGRLVIDSGSRDVELGTLAFAARTGATSIDLLTLGRIDVTGAVSTAASPAGPLRAVRIGGDASDGLATTLRVAATPTGGGRLLFDNAALDLRAARVGVGQDLLFLDSLGLVPGGAPLPVSAVTARYVSNPGSTLYVAARPYTPDGGRAPAVISAGTLSIRFTDYALVQNTAFTGTMPGGIRVGTTGGRLLLTLSAGGDRAPNAVALFGNINGVGGRGTALLGSEFVVLNGINRANSRINGCPVGSGGEGCLVPIIFTTRPTEAEESDDVVITLAEEQPMPLDAPVGASNEALIVGVDPGEEQPRPVCAEEETGGICPLRSPGSL